MYSFCYLFIMFMVYSIIGYICEIVFCSIQYKKPVLNRGFFLGPYLPIYGVSAVLMTYTLERYKNDLAALFIMSVVLCCLTEYITSYVLEKIFKVRWWDYSDRRFNIEGRICLGNACLFGIGGVSLVYIINPTLFPILDKIPYIVLITIGIISMVIFITDLVISVMTLCNIKISSREYNNKDATEEIKVLVRENLEKNSLLMTRLLNAFPKMSGKNLKITIDIKKTVNDFRKILKQNKYLNKNK